MSIFENKTFRIFVFAVVVFGYSANTAFAGAKFEWAKRLGGIGTDNGRSVVTYNSTNIIVSGLITGDADLNGDGDSTDGGAESGTGFGNTDGFISVFSTSGVYQWSKRFGGTGADAAYVHVDGQNHIIVAGSVTGNGDLNGDGDSTDGGAESGSTQDAYISVFDSSGTYLWSKRLGGTGADTAYEASTDDQNNVAILGVFVGNADANGDGDTTDGGAESGTGYGGQDGYVSVFDSLGNYKWSKRLGGTSNEGLPAAKFDGLNNLILSGNIQGNADLNGDGDSTDGGAESATGFGSVDLYISVFDTDGNYQWSRRLGSVGNDQSAYTIGVDNQNNIFVTGMVTGDVDLNSDGDTTDGDGESGTGFGGSIDVFFAKYNSSGTYQWSKRLGGLGADVGFSIELDQQYRVVVTGYVTGDADLNGDGDTTDGGAESATGYGSADGFISVFSTSGVYQWSKRLGGVSGDRGWYLNIDEQNQITFSGFGTGDADLNGDGDTTDGGAESATGYGGQDIFISAFSTEYTAPVPSFSSDTVTSDATPSIDVTLDEVATCRMSTTDESYDAMSDNVTCSGGGTTSASCTSPDLGADGVKSLYIACVDAYDNKSDPYPDTITLDSAAPTDEIAINSNDTYTNSRDVTLTILATDVTTSVTHLKVSEDNTFSGVDWEEYSPTTPGDPVTKAFTLSDGNGTKTVYVKFKDEAGNESSVYSDSITQDLSRPNIPQLSTSKNGKKNEAGSKDINLASKNFKIYFSSSDQGSSGIDKIMVSQNKEFKGANWKEYDGDISIKFDNDGKKNIYIKFKDNAGNISDVFKQIIKVDTNNPDLKITAIGSIEVDIDSTDSDNKIQTINTYQTTPTFKGIAETNSYIKMYVDDKLVKELPSAGKENGETKENLKLDGTNSFWAIKDYTFQTGTHKVKLTAQDKAKNKSSLEFNLVVNPVYSPPVVQGITTQASSSDKPAPTENIQNTVVVNPNPKPNNPTLWQRILGWFK